jgi:hypothetical protein
MVDLEQFQTVQKLEAAERQAAQGIRLFFERGDEIAIHTLAAAAYQILADLCGHKGIKRELEDSAILEEIGAKKDVLAALRQPQNFFKHADKDPNGTVRFSPMLSVGLLVYCATYYRLLTQRTFLEGNVLLMWFYLKHPDRLPEPFQSVARKAATVLDHADLEFFASEIRRQGGRNGWSIDADPQQQAAASRRMLWSGHFQR